MPTDAQRLTTLETTITQVQAELLVKARLGEVKTIVQAAETRLDVVNDTLTSHSERLGKLERWVTALKASIQGLNEDGNAVSNNISATANPTATNDGTEGYSISSVWVNVTTDHAFICLDDTTDAAVWKQMT